MKRSDHDGVAPVYVDFHKAFASPWTPGRWAVPLVCGGTFADLTRLRVRLVDGLALAPFMEDVEYTGIARCDQQRRLWCIEYEEATFRIRACHDRTHGDILCWSCAQPAAHYHLGSGSRCQRCGADLGALWAPPE